MDNKDYHIGIRCTKLAREFTRHHLDQHGWRISDAYARLVSGKGLISRKDKLAITLYRQCSAQLRRCGMPTIVCEDNIPRLVTWAKQRLTPWRANVSRYIDDQIAELAQGNPPIYLSGLRAFGATSTDLLDAYYLQEAQHMAPDDLDRWIQDLIALRPVELAALAQDFVMSSKLPYDSRYTIRCRLEDMPTIGTSTDDDGNLSDKVRNVINYIYDIPSTADECLIAYLQDNLSGLKILRKRLAELAKSPAMGDKTMTDKLERINLDMDVMAWPY